MANDFTKDIHCKALWNLESGALTTDSKGSNTLTDVNTVTSNTSDYRQGSGSADFEATNSEYLTITDANLDTGFPLKTGDTLKTISVSCWVKFESLPSGGANDEDFAIWSKWDSATAAARSMVLWVENNGAGSVFFSLGLGYSSGTLFEQKNHGYTSVTTGVWYHVTTTYRDSDKAWSIRVRDTSGNVVGSDATGTATLDANKLSLENTPFNIGTQFTDGNPIYEMDGLIDEVVVFDDVITSLEATAIALGTYKSAVDFRSSASNSSTGTTSLSINKPTGTIEGDFMVACIVVEDTESRINSVPGGWTLLVSEQYPSQTHSQLMYYKRAGASEPSSYAWGLSASDEVGGWIATFSGVRTSSPQFQYRTRTDGGSSVSAIHLGIGARNGDMVLLSVSNMYGTTWTPPSGTTPTFTERQDLRTGTGANNLSLAMATGPVEVALLEMANKTYTSANADYYLPFTVNLFSENYVDNLPAPGKLHLPSFPVVQWGHPLLGRLSNDTLGRRKGLKFAYLFSSRSPNAVNLLNNQTTVISGSPVHGNGYVTFNGSNCYISLPADEFDGWSTGTIAAVIRVNTKHDSELIGFGDTSSTNYKAAISIDSEGSVNFWIRYGSVLDGSKNIPFIDYPLGQFFHLCQVHDGTKSTIYINGKRVDQANLEWGTGSKSHYFASISSTCENCDIGRLLDNDASGSYFNGDIQSVMLWRDMALSPTEVARLAADPYEMFRPKTRHLYVSGVQSKSVTMSGGGLAGGSATTAFQKTKSVTMAGGGLCGGTAGLKASKTISGAGGGIAGGAATITAVHSVSVAMSGGGIAGGVATVTLQRSKTVAMVGGALGGGAAPTVAQRFVAGTGGGVAGGAAVTVFQKSLSFAMSGGGVAGGAATAAFQKVLSLSMAGGGIAGGAASSAFQKVLSVAMAGGGVAGGTAPYEFSQQQYQSYQMTMAGGGVAGGSATSIFQKTKSVVMAGGGVAGGSAGVVAGKVLSGVGGGVAGGAATFVTQRVLIYQATGGGIAGGSAVLVASKKFSSVGGGVAGGTAGVNRGRLYVIQGGAVAGGAAAYEFQAIAETVFVVMQGGAIAGGSAGLSGAYMWPRAAAKQGRGAVFLQAGQDVDIQALRREIKRKVEREAEERMIMATVKMFLENEDRWAA